MHVVHIERQRSLTGQTRRVHFGVRALKNAGHQVHVIAHPGSQLARHCRGDGVPVLELPLRGAALHRSTLRAAWELRRESIDVLHCHGGRDRRVAFGLKRLLGVPHVVRTKYNHSAPHTARSVREYDRCSRVIAVSGYVRDVLVGGGVAPERVEVLADGVDVARFAPRAMDPELASRFGLEPEDRVIGHVSSLHVRKGVGTLIDAFAALCTKRSDVRLLLVGKQTRRWQRRVRELGLVDRVRFAGPRDDIPECLALCDVFAMPSTAEALGTSVLEAMAMERPVVVTRVGGLAEAVCDTTGVRVPPGDPEALAAALGGLLDAPDRAQRLGRAARERVIERYSDARLASAMLDLYDRVVAAG